MRILLSGFGAMNQRVASLALNRGHEIVGVVLNNPKSIPYPVYDLNSTLPDCDVMIDFSHPDLILPLLKSNPNMPLVIATTGNKEAIVSSLQCLSESQPVFFSANMSYGVHVLTELVQYASKLLPKYDIELIERHHRNKVDGPSGTLIQLLDAIQQERSLTPITDRTQVSKKRMNNDVGISVIRGGSIVGEHEMLFAGHDETIQIIHKAQSKDIFANGALDVAEQLITKEPGYYTFHNL